ncbi:hypothetical protein M569_04541, partial [Genlisea aurea]
MNLLSKSISPTPPGWTGSDFCKWSGVSCDSSKRVTSINLSSKSLSGKIPPEIAQLSNLKTLSLQRNRFSGPLPPFSGHTSIEQINLSDNAFDSIPQHFLSGLTALQSFAVDENGNLQPWKIPNSLSDSVSLTTFSASKSNLVGEIPEIFRSFPNLSNLRLSYNNLTGPLPSSFSDSGIQNLSLNNQMTGLSGMITVLRSMPQLRIVWLQSNSFTGPIPDLSSSKELTDLVLRDNSLTGVIPDSVTKLPSLKTVALQNNKFQGAVPSFPTGVEVNLGTRNNFCLPNPGPCSPEVDTLLQIAGAMNYPSDMAENWAGNNPCQLWKFITCEEGSVAVINLSKQNFSGTISPAYSSLSHLRILHLNDNNLQGQIPASLTTLKHLQILDVSNNNISGKVPAFASSVTLNVSGNVNIGKDIPTAASQSRASSPSSSSVFGLSSGGIGTAVSPAAIIVPIAIILFVAGAISGFYIYRRRKDNRKPDFRRVSKSGKGDNPVVKVDIVDKAKKISPSTSSPTSEKSDYDISDSESAAIPIQVLVEATQNFDEKNVIGRGGFGTVYRGQLKQGTLIAVKRMECSAISDKGASEFRAEIEVLKRVRHRNLVSLHGYHDGSGGGDRLLVYEYMPQGSLGERLFRWKEMGVAPLSWNQRVAIALDIGRGVEYLHGLARQSFIHRDLKPSNILLGDDLRAKVSDFGLVRSAPEGNYSVETRLAGTFGYLAPEYATTGRVTTKVDVYAYGVILMEMITGRKALDDSLPDENCHLVTLFKRLLTGKESLRRSIDPAMEFDGDGDDDETFRCILTVGELAGHCTAREPYQRPDMSHAVNVVSTLADKWKPTFEKEESFQREGNLPQVLQRWKETESDDASFSTSFFDNTN